MFLKSLCLLHAALKHDSPSTAISGYPASLTWPSGFSFTPQTTTGAWWPVSRRHLPLSSVNIFPEWRIIEHQEVLARGFCEWVTRGVPWVGWEHLLTQCVSIPCWPPLGRAGPAHETAPCPGPQEAQADSTETKCHQIQTTSNKYKCSSSFPKDCNIW